MIHIREACHLKGVNHMNYTMNWSTSSTARNRNASRLLRFGFRKRPHVSQPNRDESLAVQRRLADGRQGRLDVNSFGLLAGLPYFQPSFFSDRSYHTRGSLFSPGVGRMISHSKVTFTGTFSSGPNKPWTYRFSELWIYDAFPIRKVIIWASCEWKAVKVYESPSQLPRDDFISLFSRAIY